MDEVLIQNARAYASQRQLQLAERLGYGIHGIVFVAKNNFNAGRTAIKIHRDAEPYARECEIYERLRSANVGEIMGFQVPELVAAMKHCSQLK